MEEEAKKTIDYMLATRQALVGCDNKKLLKILRGRVESKIDQDFGEFEELVEAEYIETARAFEAKRRQLDLFN